MILICYDGSIDSQAAIEQSAALMPGAKATVLVVWETMLDTMTRSGSLGGMGFGMIGAYGDDDVDAKIKQTALETANEGAERATSAGLIAEPHIVRRGGDISAAILSVAAEVSADAIILGTRGRGGVKSMLLGSVSQAMVHHADRPVLIVPSPEICEQRHQSAAHNAHVTAGAA